MRVEASAMPLLSWEVQDRACFFLASIDSCIKKECVVNNIPFNSNMPYSDYKDVKELSDGDHCLSVLI